MTSDPDRDLLLRVADWLDKSVQCDCVPVLADQMDQVNFTDEEARTVARVLREAAEGWRPIETAPKDGTRIMLGSLAVAKTGSTPEWSVTVGCWLAEFETEHWDYTHSGPVYRGAWTDFTVASWGYQEFTELSPVIWRPLPSPPASAPAEVSRG